MINNLATADTIVKLVLAVSVIVSYFLEVIEGPFARILMILSVLVIMLYGIKMILFAVTRD